MNNTKLSHDTNTISRLRNNFKGAIEDQIVLPKTVLIVPDNDIIKYFWYKKESDVAEGYTRLLKYLMNQYDRMVKTQNEFLPLKCRNPDPNFLWIMPPQHDDIHSKEI